MVEGPNAESSFFKRTPSRESKDLGAWIMAAGAEHVPDRGGEVV